MIRERAERAWALAYMSIGKGDPVDAIERALTDARNEALEEARQIALQGHDDITADLIDELKVKP